MGKNTRLRLVFSPTLLSCSTRFLRALQQNTAQSRLLYLLNIKQVGVRELGESGKEKIGCRGRAWSSKSLYVLSGCPLNKGWWMLKRSK